MTIDSYRCAFRMNLLTYLGIFGLLCFHVVSPQDCTEASCFELYLQNNDTPEELRCDRVCTINSEPKYCYYKLRFEPYHVMGPACGNCSYDFDSCSKSQCVQADGIERPILTYNRQMPAPPIQVCRGDVVAVDLENWHPDKSTSIHWHGIRQKETPWSDGVPMVTQCPILSSQTYRYQFRADVEGTYFYHSHSGVQKADGAYGALIIRVPKEIDDSSIHYDEDQHVMVLNDWSPISADQKIPGFKEGPHVSREAQNILINGKGLNDTFKDNLCHPELHKLLSVFEVESGRRYRFRVIGATCLICSTHVSIDNHKLKMIASDGGHSFTPVEVDKLSILSGEKYDFVVEANQPPSAYWIRVTTGTECSRNKVSQFAILKYRGDNIPSVPINKGNPPPISNPKIFNRPNDNCTVNTTTCISHLQATRNQATDDIFDIIPDDRRIILRLGTHSYGSDADQFFNGSNYKRFQVAGNSTSVTYVNRVSLMAPQYPILSQFSSLSSNDFCPLNCTDWNTLEAERRVCFCAKNETLPVDVIAELIVLDTGNIGGRTHPFHLHGFDFYVMKMGVFENPRDNAAREIELQQLINNMEGFNWNPVLKDTIGIPGGGYAILRFKTDNPGAWMYHCHFAYHVDLGMGGVILVGDSSRWNLPPNQFPRCGGHFKSDWFGTTTNILSESYESLI